MPDYPFKLRLRRQGADIWLEELAPGRSGTYFLKSRLKIVAANLVEAAYATSKIEGFGLDVDRAPAPSSNTADLPGIGG